MEVTSFTSNESQRLPFQANKTVALVLMSNKHLVDTEVPACMAVNRKFVVINKKPNQLKVIQRITGQHTTVDITVDAGDFHFQSYQDSDVFVAVSKGGGKLAILSLQEAADGSIVATQDASTAPEGIIKVVPMSPTTVALLGESGTVYSLNCADGKVSTIFSQSVKGSVQPVMSVHPTKNLVAVSGSTASTLDILSADTQKSVLAKPWSPHGDEVVTSVHFFTQRSHDSKPIILTAGAKNTEVRMWTLGENGNVSLCQHVTVAGETDEEPGKARLVAIAPHEDYVLLPSTETGSIVVFEMDSNSPRFRRVTDWKASAPVLNCGSIIRKVSGSAGAKNVNMELGLVVRTTERVEILAFDNSRLDGSANIGEHKKETKEASSSIMKWFGSGNNAGPPPSVAVSSSLSHQQKGGAGDSTIIEKQALAALRRQADYYAMQMAAVDEKVVLLQRSAGETLKTLQSGNSQNDARSIGRDFAMRNKQRLESGLNSAAAAGNGAPQQADQSLVVLRGFADSIGPTLLEATQITCESVLGKTLPHVCESSMQQLDIASSLDSSVPKLTATTSMQSFSQAVDKIHQAQNKIFKQEVNVTQNRTNAAVASSEKIVAHSIKNFKTYMSNVKKEMTALETDLHGLKMGGHQHSFTSAASMDADATFDDILQSAVVLCTRRQWNDGITKILDAANVPLLIRFLETDEISDLREELVDPENLPFPAFLSLSHQLSHDLRSSLGAVPLRVSWLHELAVEWDDTLHTMKQGGKDAQLIQSCRGEFQHISDALSIIDKTEVDRETRRNLQLIRKVFKNVI